MGPNFLGGGIFCSFLIIQPFSYIILFPKNNYLLYLGNRIPREVQLEAFFIQVNRVKVTLGLVIPKTTNGALKLTSLFKIQN